MDFSFRARRALAPLMAALVTAGPKRLTRRERAVGAQALDLRVAGGQE
jgi:hypothetical protein